MGPNKYRFLLMLSVNAFARAPAESLLRVYERREQHCSSKRVGDVDPAGVVNLSLDG